MEAAVLLAASEAEAEAEGSASDASPTNSRPAASALASLLEAPAGEAVGAPAALVFSWGDGDFSDCEVSLAGKTYPLHRLLLTKGPRCCGFFEGAFREGGVRQSPSAPIDLTDLLPEPCHDHFESALRFIYGHELIFTEANAVCLYKVGDVLQGAALVRASSSAMDGLYAEAPGWRAAASFLDAGTRLECEGVVAAFLPRLVRVGAPRCASEPLLTAACARFPSAAVAMLAEISECSGWRWDAGSILVRPVDTCTLSHCQATFAAEGAARLLPDIEGARSCALVTVCIKCSGPTIGVTTVTCDLLSQRHADGGFARAIGGWGLSLASGGLWAEGRRVGQVPQEVRSSLVGSRIVVHMDAAAGILSFSGPGWQASIETDFGKGPGLRFTAYACCGGTAYALA